MNAASRSDGPMVLRRAFSLLRLLSAQPEGLNLSSIATSLDVPKSSLSTTLSGLTEQGYLRRRGSLYVLGEEAWALASAMMGGRSMRQIARPILERTVTICEETVLLAALDDDHTNFSYIDFVESTKSIRFCAKIGDRRPLYPTACGRLFLAFMSAEERDTYFKKVKMKPTTETTLVDRKGIESVGEEIRRTGVSVTMGNYSADAGGFAAPIWSGDGTLAGGLVIGVPLARGEREYDKFCKIVAESAHAISHVLGYRGAPSDGGQRAAGQLGGVATTHDLAKAAGFTSA